MNSVATNLYALEEREGFEPSVRSHVRLISSPTCDQRTCPKCAPALKIHFRANRVECIECAQLDKKSPTIGSAENGMPRLLQDETQTYDSKALSRWFASRPNARQEAREVAAALPNPTDQPKD